MSLTGTRVPGKVTGASLLQQKQRGTAITALTAYDFPTARLLDQAGVDVVLVGDSVAMAVLGHADTLSITVDEMLHHVKAARRGVERALLVADMPFGSYQVSTQETLRNGLRFVKEGGAEAVKLEGGRAVAARVRAMVQAEIPVIGHIGLTPQAVHRMGGYKVQGRSEEAAAALVEDALALEDAGALAVVLEGIPRELAERITGLLRVPTIGIGAGPQCDGQILVFHDAFGLSVRPLGGGPAKFVRQFGDVAGVIRQGLEEYRAAVEARSFPADSESYHMPRLLAEAAR